MHEGKANKTLRKYFYVKYCKTIWILTSWQLISYELLLHCPCSVVAVSEFVLLLAEKWLTDSDEKILPVIQSDKWPIVE